MAGDEPVFDSQGQGASRASGLRILRAFVIVAILPGLQENPTGGRPYTECRVCTRDYAFGRHSGNSTQRESAASLVRGIRSAQSILQAYLDEMTWRFDDRNNPYIFRDTMMKLIEAPVLEYKKLTRAA
jgi:hypothetical protein